MKWLATATATVAGIALVSRHGTRDRLARFHADIQRGMSARETQLREVLAMDTHLTLPAERADARAIEGR